ncbi:hypothetical protein ACFOYW_14195 [Gryllotalpicola reticulitermitis]|uniref:Septum formation-related domain-containing protein n=1 Tax=Gryllotalpicola reticulitermitis TaxID=1184153 RepID=A0ABV8QB90_9MICO
MSQDDELVSPPRDEAIRTMLMDTVDADPTVRRQRKRRRTLVFGSIGVLVAASVGIGAGLVVHAQGVTNTSVVHCLSSAHRGLGGKYPDASASLASTSGVSRADDAIGLCQDMWRQGVFEPGYNPTSSNNRFGTVPSQLTVCVMKDGSAAVVPGDERDICQGIGLAPLKP